MEVYFRVQAEFICKLVRDQYWTEHKPYKQAIKSLIDSFGGLTEEDAKQILLGNKILKGLYPDEDITLEDDDKHQEYLNNRKYIYLEERIAEEKNLTDYEEFLIALRNTIPSYYCKYENHTMDNRFISYIADDLFRQLQKNNLKLIGICLNPEYAKESRTGIYVEDQVDFSRFWCHFADMDIYLTMMEQVEENGGNNE